MYVKLNLLRRTGMAEAFVYNRSSIHSCTRPMSQPIRVSPLTEVYPTLTTNGPGCCAFSPQVDPYILPSERGKLRPSEFKSRASRDVDLQSI